VPIGTSLGNGYDLYDISGNVSEWCLDGAGWQFYKNSPYKNPIEGEASITELVSNFKNVEIIVHRARRGGAWNDTKRFIAVFHRDYNLPNRTEAVLGFRCVKEATP
jgi:formylglycine-generating enzyme required for sulfatase activity